jgi:hypothetical protein
MSSWLWETAGGIDHGPRIIGSAHGEAVQLNSRWIIGHGL